MDKRVVISIHAPREGGDFAFAYVVNTDNSISIHAPREGGDDTVVQREEEMKISIHAPREGGDTVNGILKLIRMIISIHAPREGGRHRQFMAKAPDARISIHAPREGGDGSIASYPAGTDIFQSTPPARGATAGRRHYGRSGQDFNPRPPRGGRRYRLFDGSGYQYISIPAPREGGDYKH